MSEAGESRFIRAVEAWVESHGTHWPDLSQLVWADYDRLRSDVPRGANWADFLTLTIARARDPESKIADLQALMIELQTAARAIEQQRVAAATTEPPGLALAAYHWTVVSALVGMLGVLIALLALVQDRIEADRSDPPPSVTVVVEPPDAGEIARQVDERLREREQQHQAVQSEATGAPEPKRGENRTADEG